MTEAALDDRIRNAIARGAVVAMSLSGGKDSTAPAYAVSQILDAAGHPRSRRIAVHADLGRAERRETPATVEAIADKLSLPLHVVRQTRHDLVGRWQQAGTAHDVRAIAATTAKPNRSSPLPL